MPTRHSYSYIKESFAAKGYTLLSKTYINSKKGLRLLCPNGHECELTFHAFSTRDAVCRYCTINYHPDEVKKTFEAEGYILLDEYKRCDSYLKVICPEGHKYKTQFRYFIRGNRCRTCANADRSLGLAYVKEKIEEAGYVLLSKTYKNKNTRLICRCPEGHEVNTTADNFITNGSRCVTCRWIKGSGPGCHFWKGGVSCEPYCQEWVPEFKDYIKSRDGYRCLNPDCLANPKKDLVVHHVDYNKKHCEPKNLITICRSCNGRANSDREWHTAWYQAILNKRYGYKYRPSSSSGQSGTL